MLRMTEQIRFSDYEGLYERLIPKDHLLRRLKELVDFSFILDELKSKYCMDNGRGAINPIRLFKYLLLKALYRMSDRDLVERSKYDLSFKYFLNYLPEDDVISPSELTKFRKQRLKDENLLDLLIKKSVSIALEHGVIKSKTIIVDSTHSTSRYNSVSPQEALQQQAKALRKAVYRIDASQREKFPAKVSGRDLNEQIKYCEALLKSVCSEERLMVCERIREMADLLREMINDDLENIKLSADTDAKTGHKSADTSFFGYKTHISMSEERVVTAAVVTTGEKSDGKHMAELVEKTEEAGIEVEAVIGDAAYSTRDNIEYAKGKFELISRLHPEVVQGYRKDEEKFDFNKDAGMYVCPAGHMAISKTRRHNKQPERKENPRMVYYFDVEKCKRCPMRDGCYKEGSGSKSYSISLGCEAHLEQKEFQETEHFKELSAHRYKIEAKNGELKNRYGYGQAESSGIQAMQLQAATTLFAANLKRIVKLIDG